MSLSFPLFPRTSHDSAEPPPAEPLPVEALLARMRERLATEIHMGLVAPGDRLPSIRSLAQETGIDHRAVAEVYHSLEAEGLVEVRGRSGVYVAPPEERDGNGSPRGGEGWLADFVAEGWRRRLSSGHLHQMLRTLADGSRLRCACVESNEDQMEAYCAELGSLSGMEMIRAYLEPADRKRVADGARLAPLGALLDRVDLVVTTTYHAAAVRALLGDLGVPVVVLRINPALAAAVRSRIRAHGLTIIAATHQFGERMRLMYADAISRPEQVRVVLATDRARLRDLDPSEPVLLTRAARRLLAGTGRREMVFPHSPTIHPETVREIAGLVIGLNAARQHAAS